MDKSIWEKAVRENEEIIGSYNRCEGEVCTKEEESISIVKRGKRRNEGVHLGAAKEGIYSAIKVTSNGASVLHGEERYEKANGLGL